MQYFWLVAYLGTAELGGELSHILENGIVKDGIFSSVAPQICFTLTISRGLKFVSD